MIVFAAVAVSPSPARVPLVLIVEDHDDTRVMYVTYLSSSFDLIEAADAEQALARVAERRPDLIITDLSLPGMDGFDLIARLRRDEATRTIPVISLSGYSGQLHEDRARAAGSDRVLQKPCMPDALLDAAEELLRDTADGSNET